MMSAYGAAPFSAEARDVIYPDLTAFVADRDDATVRETA